MPCTVGKRKSSKKKEIELPPDASVFLKEAESVCPDCMYPNGDHAINCIFLWKDLTGAT